MSRNHVRAALVWAVLVTTASCTCQTTDLSAKDSVKSSTRPAGAGGSDSRTGLPLPTPLSPDVLNGDGFTPSLTGAGACGAGSCDWRLRFGPADVRFAENTDFECEGDVALLKSKRRGDSAAALLAKATSCWVQPFPNDPDGVLAGFDDSPSLAPDAAVWSTRVACVAPGPKSYRVVCNVACQLRAPTCPDVSCEPVRFIPVLLTGAVVEDGGFSIAVHSCSDAGVPELDAGADAGVDAGFDAGVDAGFDAGAGNDGGSCLAIPETCWNGVDDNCNGRIDEGCTDVFAASGPVFGFFAIDGGLRAETAGLSTVATVAPQPLPGTFLEATALALDEDAGMLYALDGIGGAVWRYDFTSPSPSRTLVVDGGTPTPWRGLTIDAPRRLMYSIDSVAGTVRRVSLTDYSVSTATGTFAPSTTGGLVAAPDGSLLVTAWQLAPCPADVVRMDPTSGQQTIVVSQHLCFPEQLAVGPDGSIYVADSAPPPMNVSLIRKFDSVGAPDLGWTPPAFQIAFGVALAPSGDLLVPSFFDGTLWSINATTAAQTSVASGLGPAVAAVEASNGSVYVASGPSVLHLARLGQTASGTATYVFEAPMLVTFDVAAWQVSPGAPLGATATLRLRAAPTLGGLQTAQDCIVTTSPAALGSCSLSGAHLLVEARLFTPIRNQPIVLQSLAIEYSTPP